MQDIHERHPERYGLGNLEDTGAALKEAVAEGHKALEMA